MKTETAKKFRLDLSEYTVEALVPKRADGKEDGPIIDGHEMVKQSIPYPFRGNCSSWLRTAGMFKTIEDVAEAVCLAKQIRDAKDDFLILDEKEATILRAVMNKHLEHAAEHNSGFGGEIHEEAICRVANMEEVEN